MKIIHIAETAKGGVGTIIKSLAEFQTMQGCNVEILLPDEHSGLLNLKNIITFNRNGRTISGFINLYSAFRKINKKNRYDVIHLHSSFAGLILRLAFFLKLTDIKNSKIIYTPHAFSFLMNVGNFKRKLYQMVELFLSKYTNKIVCNSYYEYQCALAAGISKSKMVVIYNGINVNNATMAKKTEKSEGEKEKRINILFIGRFDYQKGYDILIKLITKLDSKRYLFTLVGEGVRGNYERLSLENVEYTGWLNNENLVSLYTNASFLIMPSRWESFGLVAIESQLYGTPVLANNCSSLPEVIKDNETGMLLDFDNLDNICDFINSRSEDDWKKLGENSVDFIVENFSDTTMNIKYFNLYKKVMK